MANYQTRGNHNQAPVLKFSGKKDSDGGFYQLPQKLCDIIFKEFARSPAPLRLMLVLCGTKPGFNLTEKWVLERTSMTHKTYFDARALLEKKGWITCGSGEIIVNFDKILGGIESIPQINGVSSQYVNSERSIESIHQKSSIESIRQKNENELGYSLNTSNGDRVNTSKELQEYSVNTNWGIESIPIIYNNKHIEIDKLQYITGEDIMRLAEPPVWITDEVVELANGKQFRVSKEEREKIDWSKIF